MAADGGAMVLIDDIRAAFPTSPYPGDHILSNCWCDDCEFSVRNLRGKSWKQLRLEDFNGESADMSLRAFRYYLPGLMCLAVQNPDDSSLSSMVGSRFIVSDVEPLARMAEVQETVNRLSMQQRRAVASFFQWMACQERQSPLLVEAAMKSVMSRRVEPYRHNELLAYYSNRKTKR